MLRHLSDCPSWCCEFSTLTTAMNDLVDPTVLFNPSPINGKKDNNTQSWIDLNGTGSTSVALETGRSTTLAKPSAFRDSTDALGGSTTALSSQTSSPITHHLLLPPHRI